MQFCELMYWSGLVSLVASCCCFGLIGFRNSVWYGPHRSVSAKLKPVDIKIAKIGATLFIIAVLFFIIGAMAK